MPPVIFTGVSMRAILLAAAAAIWAGNAGAAVYTLTFIADDPSAIPEWYSLDPVIILDVPSLRNLDIFQQYRTDNGEEWTDDLIPPVLALPAWPTGWSDTELSLKTDSRGKLTHLFFYWDAYWEGQDFSLSGWGGYWIDYEGIQGFGTSGKWVVTPASVPLPATAPLLLAALALAGVVRARASRGARPTSVCTGRIPA